MDVRVRIIYVYKKRNDFSFTLILFFTLTVLPEKEFKTEF